MDFAKISWDSQEILKKVFLRFIYMIISLREFLSFEHFSIIVILTLNLMKLCKETSLDGKAFTIDKKKKWVSDTYLKLEDDKHNFDF